MKKTILYLSKIIIIAIILQLIILPSISNAADTWTDVFQSGSEFIEKGKQGVVTEGETGDGEEVLDDSEIQSTTSVIFNSLLTIGIVLTVIIGIILGIKFMIASAEDKAEIKKALIPYILGCVLIFGAFTIWKLVVSILNNL